MTGVWRLLLVVVAFGAARPQPVLVTPTSVQPINRVRELGFRAAGTVVTVEGVVTRYRAGRSLTLQDKTGSLFLYTDQNQTLVPGDIVQATGRAGTEDGTPVVNAATYRQVGTTDPPQPIAISATDLAKGGHEAELVSLDGTLVRSYFTRYERAFVIQSGGSEFPVWVLNASAGSAQSIGMGSRVRVTGVVSIKMSGDKPSGFELLGRSGADIFVVQAAGWWNDRRVILVATALAGSVVLLLSYVFLLRRQVERQTATIRERLQQEEELKEQYRQSQRMESVGRLAGGIAHDFNNIMTVVMGHVEVLGHELQEHPDLMESVNEIRSAADRASGVTRQLLAFGRRARLQPEVIDLNVTIQEMASLFARVLGGDIETQARPCDETVTILADRRQLEQALLNLAVNARDAMPEGGRLTLAADRREDDRGRALGVVTVRDTGTGIPADVQPHIFDPFFTTKDVGQGSGLGLAMIYGFMQQTGGSVHFESAAGAGTMFQLSFPLHLQTAGDD